MKKLICYLLLAALLLSGCAKQTAADPASVTLPEGYSIQAAGDGTWNLLNGEDICGALTRYPLPKNSSLGPNNYDITLLELLLRDLGLIPEGDYDRMLDSSVKGPSHLFIGDMIDGEYVSHDYDLILTKDSLYTLEELGDYPQDVEEALRKGLPNDK